MARTFTPQQAVELAVVERNTFIESRHIGSAMVLNTDGSVLRSLGDPTELIFPRSALKPFQTIALLSKGLQLDPLSIALTSASHTGTPQHVQTVRGILARASIPEGHLQCPAVFPRDKHARNNLIAAGKSPSPIYMMCSGKHAAMLLTCRVNNWPTESYCEDQHPLQTHICETIERLSGEKISFKGVDGCGLPTYALPLSGLAKGMHRFTSALVSSPFALFKNAATVRESILHHPWSVEGPEYPDTLVIEHFGVFAKSGAEGVLVLCAPGGQTVALKILDGSSRAATIVGLRLLADTGAITHSAIDEMLPKLHLEVAGGVHTVGQIRASF